MLEQLLHTLAAEPAVNDWLVRQVRTTSSQYYLARRQPENRRTADTERVEVEVFSDHPAARSGAPSRGSATFTLVPGDEARLGERVRQAVFMAALADNPPFGLPGPAVYPSVLTADRALRAEPLRVAEELADHLLALVAEEPNISLASAEFFVDWREETLYNSRGIEATQEDSSLLLDFVLLARDPRSGREMEAHIESRWRARQNLDLPELVRRQAQYARDTLEAGEPRTGRFPVIVSGQALRDLLVGMSMSPLAVRASAQYKYQQLSPWEIGQSIFDDGAAVGDPLTVYGNAVLPWGLKSAAFDREGLPGRRLQIIENGVLRSFWASQRYADYLRLPPTGQFGNLEILPGSLPVAEMWAGGGILYHIVAFSSMAPDPITGHFVGEIRLGYEREGNLLRPIKGGSLSGNLFADLAPARLSQETVFLGDYLGPEAVRYPTLTISGG